MSLTLDELTQEQYEKIKKLYWVLDDEVEPAWSRSMQIWYDWRAGKYPDRTKEQIREGMIYRRPTFAEACRRQSEWNNWKINYIHWHWKIEERRPFPKDTVMKWGGRTVYEINKDNILFAQTITAGPRHW